MKVKPISRHVSELTILYYEKTVFGGKVCFSLLLPLILQKI